MFRQFMLWVLSLFVLAMAHAQIIQPAKISAVAPVKTLSVGDETDLVFTATVDKDWYIYSVGFDADCGPIPFVNHVE